MLSPICHANHIDIPNYVESVVFQFGLSTRQIRFIKLHLELGSSDVYLHIFLVL